MSIPDQASPAIESVIVSETYFSAAEGMVGHAIDASIAAGEQAGTIDTPDDLDLVTLCVLRLSNDTKVVGVHIGPLPENFDADMGRKLAKQHAVDQVVPMLNYAMRDRVLSSIGVRQAVLSERQACADLVQSHTTWPAGTEPSEVVPVIARSIFKRTHDELLARFITSDTKERGEPIF